MKRTSYIKWLFMISVVFISLVIFPYRADVVLDLLKFSLRLILTLVIEISIALLFRFTLKKSLKPLLITNITTQVLLNIVIQYGYSKGGLIVALAGFILMEALIIIVETTVYAKLLTEKPVLRRILYGITANALSLIGGYLLLFI